MHTVAYIYKLNHRLFTSQTEVLMIFKGNINRPPNQLGWGFTAHEEKLNRIQDLALLGIVKIISPKLIITVYWLLFIIVFSPIPHADERYVLFCLDFLCMDFLSAQAFCMSRFQYIEFALITFLSF